MAEAGSKEVKRARLEETAKDGAKDGLISLVSLVSSPPKAETVAKHRDTGSRDAGGLVSHQVHLQCLRSSYSTTKCQKAILFDASRMM